MRAQMRPRAKMRQSQAGLPGPVWWLGRPGLDTGGGRRDLGWQSGLGPRWWELHKSMPRSQPPWRQSGLMSVVAGA